MSTRVFYVDRENDVVSAFAHGDDLRLSPSDPAVAARWFAEAANLCTDRWTCFRQASQLEGIGKASGPEHLARLRALGDRHYYDEIEWD